MKIIYPWFLVGIIERVAWHCGYSMTVQAIAGPGWHSGRIGAERIFFSRRRGDEKRLPKLKPYKGGPVEPGTLEDRNDAL